MNETLLYDWLVLVTGYDEENVIRANQNGPRPVAPFATWQITTSEPADYSYIETQVVQTPDEEDEEIIHLNGSTTLMKRHIVSVDVNIYDPDGRSILSNLEMSNARTDVRQIFAPGTVLIGASVIRDMTEVMDTKFVPRYQAEFRFRTFVENTHTDVDHIWESYDITGELTDGDEITIPIEVADELPPIGD